MVEPSAPTRLVVSDRAVRCQVPVISSPLRKTASGPLPTSCDWTSRPPSLFSSQGPRVTWTVWTTMLATPIRVPSATLAGAPLMERSQAPLYGLHVQLLSLVPEKGMEIEPTGVPVGTVEE